jgi:hypothetical protein
MEDEIDRDARGRCDRELRQRGGRELEIRTMIAIAAREHGPRRGCRRQGRTTIAVVIARGPLDRTHARHGHEARDDDCPDRAHSCP